MKLSMAAGLGALVTLLAVSVLADDPLGMLRTGQRWVAGEPDGSSRSGDAPPQRVQLGPKPAIPSPSPIPGASSKPPATAPGSNIQSSGDEAASARKMEDLVHQSINQQRQDHGLGPLAYDIGLADIARNHSADMAELDYFAHQNPAGEEPTDRGVRQGYDCRKEYGTHYTYGIAENLFQGWLYSSITYLGLSEHKNWKSTREIVEDAVTGWMNSPGHRANILNEAYGLEGIGIVIAANDKVYVTQNFC